MFRCVDIKESSNGISFTSFSSKTVLKCGFEMDYSINKLASWLFPFIKSVLSISAAVPGFEPVHSWTITRTRTAAVSKLRKPRKGQHFLNPLKSTSRSHAERLTSIDPSTSRWGGEPPVSSREVKSPINFFRFPLGSTRSKAPEFDGWRWNRRATRVCLCTKRKHEEATAIK